MNKFPIFYQTYGDANNPCIILINGIGGQLIDWSMPFIQRLVDQHFFVVAFDNRDSGLSKYYDELGVPNFKEILQKKAKGEEVQPFYTLKDMADDVIKLMDHLNIKKTHLLGNSMGGIIAQYVAINHPNRLLSLILISTTSSDLTLPPAKEEVLNYFTSSTTSEIKSIEENVKKKIELFRLYNHPDYFNEEKTRKEILASYQRANHVDGFKRLLLAMVAVEPRTSLLKNINIPTLIIHGDYDPVFSIEHGKHLANVIPNSQLIVYEKMGHGLSEYFYPDAITAITDFINM